MDNGIEDRIKTFKNSLDLAKNKIATLQGTVGGLVFRLKEELGIDGIEAAKRRREEIKVLRESHENKVQELVKTIQSQYDFGFDE